MSAIMGEPVAADNRKIRFTSPSEERSHSNSPLRYAFASAHRGGSCSASSTGSGSPRGNSVYSNSGVFSGGSKTAVVSASVTSGEGTSGRGVYSLNIREGRGQSADHQAPLVSSYLPASSPLLTSKESATTAKSALAVLVEIKNKQQRESSLPGSACRGEKDDEGGIPSRREPQHPSQKGNTNNTNPNPSSDKRHGAPLGVSAGHALSPPHHAAHSQQVLEGRSSHPSASKGAAVALQPLQPMLNSSGKQNGNGPRGGEEAPHPHHLLPHCSPDRHRRPPQASIPTNPTAPSPANNGDRRDERDFLLRKHPGALPKREHLKKMEEESATRGQRSGSGEKHLVEMTQKSAHTSGEAAYTHDSHPHRQLPQDAALHEDVEGRYGHTDQATARSDSRGLQSQEGDRAKEGLHTSGEAGKTIDYEKELRRRERKLVALRQQQEAEERELQELKRLRDLEDQRDRLRELVRKKELESLAEDQKQRERATARTPPPPPPPVTAASPPAHAVDGSTQRNPHGRQHQEGVEAITVSALVQDPHRVRTPAKLEPVAISSLANSPGKVASTGGRGSSIKTDKKSKKRSASAQSSESSTSTEEDYRRFLQEREERKRCQAQVGGTAGNAAPHIRQEDGRLPSSRHNVGYNFPSGKRGGGASSPKRREPSSSAEKGSSNGVSSLAARSFTHTKSREEMQRDFDRRSRENHKRFLRLCGRLTKKKRGGTAMSSTLNTTFNGTFSSAANGTCEGQQTIHGIRVVDEDTGDFFNGTFNGTFNGSALGGTNQATMTQKDEELLLAAALKDLPISEDTIGNTNRDEELQYAQNILPLVKAAATDEDGDPMVFGLGTIGIANREREKARQRAMRGTSLDAASGGEGQPHTEAEEKKPQSVFDRLRKRKPPTAVSLAVVREKRKLLERHNFNVREAGMGAPEGGSAGNENPLFTQGSEDNFMNGGQRAFNMSEFLLLQRLVKSGQPLQQALEAMKEMTKREDQEKRRREKEAAEEEARKNFSRTASPHPSSPDSKTDSSSPPLLPPMPSSSGGKAAVPPPPAPTGKFPALGVQNVPPSPASPSKRSNAGGDKVPPAPPQLTPLQKNAPSALSLAMPPPPPPPPPPPGGVLDAFGYFSSHRVQPLYYHQLEGSGASLNSSSNLNGSNPPSSTSSKARKRKNGGANATSPTATSSMNGSLNSTPRRRLKNVNSSSIISTDRIKFLTRVDSSQHSHEATPTNQYKKGDGV